MPTTGDRGLSIKGSSFFLNVYNIESESLQMRFSHSIICHTNVYHFIKYTISISEIDTLLLTQLKFIKRAKQFVQNIYEFHTG